MLNVYIQCRGATVKIPTPDTCTLTLFLYEIFRETPKKLTIFVISLTNSSFLILMENVKTLFSLNIRKYNL